MTVRHNDYHAQIKLEKYPEQDNCRQRLSADHDLAPRYWPQTHVIPTGFAILPIMTGAEIKAARKARGWTQAGLSALVGTPRPTLAAWETGQCRPSPDYVAKLQEIFTSQPVSPSMPAAELRELQARNGWTTRAVARFIGVPISTVYQWRIGRLSISPAKREALRAADGGDIAESP